MGLGASNKCHEEASVRGRMLQVQGAHNSRLLSAPSPDENQQIPEDHLTV